MAAFWQSNDGEFTVGPSSLAKAALLLISNTINNEVVLKTLCIKIFFLVIVGLLIPLMLADNGYSMLSGRLLLELNRNPFSRHFLAS